MAAATKKADPITFPCSFRSTAYPMVMAGVLAVWGVGGAAWVFARQPQAATIVGVFALVFVALFVVIASAIVRVDDDGIRESCLLFKTTIAWSDVGGMEKLRNRGVSIKSTSDRQLFLLTLLTGPQQTAIADEAVKRAGLQRDSSDQKKLQRDGIAERWIKS